MRPPRANMGASIIDNWCLIYMKKPATSLLIAHCLGNVLTAQTGLGCYGHAQYWG